MSKAIFRSNRGEFNRIHYSLIDMILGHMAMDIDIGLKTTAGMPVEFGQMKGATRWFKAANGRYRVEINKEYAGPQEAGIVNGHPVKHYTTAGTSAGFFERATDRVWLNRLSYILEARRAHKI